MLFQLHCPHNPRVLWVPLQCVLSQTSLAPHRHPLCGACIDASLLPGGPLFGCPPPKWALLHHPLDFIWPGLSKAAKMTFPTSSSNSKASVPPEEAPLLSPLLCGHAFSLTLAPTGTSLSLWPVSQLPVRAGSSPAPGGNLSWPAHHHLSSIPRPAALTAWAVPLHYYRGQYVVSGFRRLLFPVLSWAHDRGSCQFIFKFRRSSPFLKTLPLR